MISTYTRLMLRTIISMGHMPDVPRVKCREPCIQVYLSKAERKGLSYADQQELRRYKSWFMSKE
jgi:hypothetical protein